MSKADHGRNVFDSAAERAAAHDVTPHGLRHSTTSLAIAAGATVVVVQRMLGHSSQRLPWDVYSHLFADDLDTVAERLYTAKINAAADKARIGHQVIKLSVETMPEVEMLSDLRSCVEPPWGVEPQTYALRVDLQVSTVVAIR